MLLSLLALSRDERQLLVHGWIERDLLRLGIPGHQMRLTSETHQQCLPGRVQEGWSAGHSLPQRVERTKQLEDSQSIVRNEAGHHWRWMGRLGVSQTS